MKDKLITKSLTVSFMLIFSVGACGQKNTITATAKASTTSPAKQIDSRGSKTITSRVKKIVFIDKEKACQCTHRRIQDTWLALNKALKDRKNILLERFHLDTQEPLTAHYTSIRPLMVPPGIYFLDHQGKILEMLEGEISADQIGAVFNKK
jgi:hypothetical protein